MWSIEAQVAFHQPELARPDKPGVGDAHLEQLAVEIARPELEEFPQLRKQGMQIVVLPHETLNERRMVRHAVKDLRRRQAVALKLRCKIVCGHTGFPSVCLFVMPLTKKVSLIRPQTRAFLCQVSALAAAAQSC